MEDNIYILHSRCGSCAYLGVSGYKRDPFKCGITQRPLSRYVSIGHASQCPNHKNHEEGLCEAILELYPTVEFK